MEKFSQYKGIFYNNKTTHHYYEGGAHFSYAALVKKLIEIKNEMSQSDISSKLDSPSKKKEHKILKDIKKSDKLVLLRQKNQSTGCLLENSKKVKADEIYNKIMNDQLDIDKNNKMKILQKVKNKERDKFSNLKDKINKNNFNSSIYNVHNFANMPLLFAQNKRSKNNIFKDNENNGNIELKKIRRLSNLEVKHKNLNSTIGFNEDNKYIKYYLKHNFDINYHPSYNKNISSLSSNSRSVRKNNNIISINKFDFINKLKNKNHSLSKNKNTNSIDYNIKFNNIIKMNEIYFGDTKLNFETDKSIKRKLLANDSKRRENNNMNISIFNFSKLKYPNKFIINKVSNKI